MLSAAGVLKCRERKRAQLHTLSARTLALEEENAHLKEALGMRNTEVAGLRDKLASLTRGARGDKWTASSSEPAVLSGLIPVVLVAVMLWLPQYELTREAGATLSLSLSLSPSHKHLKQHPFRQCAGHCNSV